MYNNKKQNCTISKNGMNEDDCLNNTDNQCLFHPLQDTNKYPLSNPSFEKYYYPWCYYKPDSYMLFSNNIKENCDWKKKCAEKNLGIFSKDSNKPSTIDSRKNSITNENYNWSYYKNSKKPYNTNNIEICNIPNTNEGTYPNCSDCIIKAGGGASCTDILMTPNNYNLNNIGFFHYPLIRIGNDGFENNFLDVPSKPKPDENRMTYTWPSKPDPNENRMTYTLPDKPGDFEIYYKNFNCNYKNSQCEECSCVFDTLKTTFIIPKNSNISSNSKVPYVIVYGFEQNNAYNFGWHLKNNKTYPIFTADLLSDGTSIYSDNDNITNTKTYFENIKQIVYSGIAIIGLSNNFGTTNNGRWTSKLYDYGPYLPGKPKDLSSVDSTLYWNNGDNYMNNYLKELMDYIYINPDLDYNRCGLMGYSLGAQMISRFYQEFPTMTTTNGIAFPNISCGIMIAGGSLHCFDDMSPNSCPEDKTEPIYDNGYRGWANHPPTLLTQNIPDSYSDQNASSNYFNVLAKNGVPCYLINKTLNTKGKHAIAVCKNYWNNKENVNDDTNDNDLTLIMSVLFLLKYL
jgi:hypothetical protein